MISGKILSRAGKATGKYKHWYNLQKNANGSIMPVDLQNDFSEWEVLSEETEMLVLFNTEAVSAAKDKEVSSWQNNDVYEEVDDVGQEYISVRWVITEKVKQGKPLIKARLVARGFEECTTDLRKDSPTCYKETERLALAFATSKKWSCHTIDVKAAFLQGNDIQREVYLHPPPEYANGKLWRLKKTVYGLSDASRHWYLRVKCELLALGMTMSKLEPALFSWRKYNKVEGIICIYVADFLWAGTENFQKQIIDRLNTVFHVGSSESGSFKYTALNVTSYIDYVTVDQCHYALSLQPISISRHRAAVKNPDLSSSEKAEYRALVGQLNWLVTHTRPDIAFDICELSVACNKATVGDLLRLSKIILRVTTDNLRLIFPEMQELEECVMECFSDASFANVPGCGSQGGFIIFLRDSAGSRCPVYWQSRRIRRVVKSTLAAETLALLECVEAAVYLSNIVLNLAQLANKKIRCFVDNKSLVDTLYSLKGLMIEDCELIWQSCKIC